MLMTTPALSFFKEDTGMWKEGNLKVQDRIYHYWMNVYVVGSQFCINGGKVSKLMLKRNDKVVCNYDRGWDIEPADPDTQLAVEILLHGNNY
jgi:hypothetical protein